MPRAATLSERLTKAYVNALLPRAQRYRVGDKVQRGLKIVVEPGGRKYWTVKYVTCEGRESEKVLGEWPGMLIDQARTDAAMVRSRIKRQGVDPAEEARRARAEAERVRQAEREARAKTFKALADAYIEASKKGFRSARQQRPKSASTISKERQYLDKHVIPKFGPRPIGEIRRKEIVDFLEKVAHKSGEGASNSCLEVIRRAFAYARHREEIEHNPALEIPAYARPPRDVIASDDELRAIWLALEEAKEAPPPDEKGETHWHERNDTYLSACALQIAILTLQRRGEIVSIHKDHIDWSKRLWIIPALNKKERRRGLVPLGPMAMHVLKQAFEHSGGEWAFRGRNPDKHMEPHSLTRFMARLREDKGVKEITPHDLRRTGRTKLTSDEVGVDEMTAERVLNHVVGSRQQRAYDWQAYTSQKRAALEAWERELKRIVRGARGGIATTAREVAA